MAAGRSVQRPSRQSVWAPRMSSWPRGSWPTFCVTLACSWLRSERKRQVRPRSRPPLREGRPCRIGGGLSSGKPSSRRRSTTSRACPPAGANFRPMRSVRRKKRSPSNRYTGSRSRRRPSPRYGERSELNRKPKPAPPGSETMSTIASSLAICACTTAGSNSSAAARGTPRRRPGHDHGLCLGGAERAGGCIDSSRRQSDAHSVGRGVRSSRTALLRRVCPAARVGVACYGPRPTAPSPTKKRATWPSSPVADSACRHARHRQPW